MLFSTQPFSVSPTNGVGPGQISSLPLCGLNSIVVHC